MIPITLNRERFNRDQCEAWFDWLLKKAREENPDVEALPAGALCQTLRNLGMARDTEEKKLSIMLQSSGYADKNGFVDFKQFTLFAEDVKLFDGDGVALSNFFRFLETDEVRVLTRNEFMDAFEAVGLPISDPGAEIVEMFVNLPRDFDVNQTFEQFLQIVHGIKQIKAGQSFIPGKSLQNKNKLVLHRIMAFAATYARKTVITPFHDVSPRTPEHCGFAWQENLWEW